MHPISNLVDLKRRLGFSRRCFGYFHSAMPGMTISLFSPRHWDDLLLFTCSLGKNRSCIVSPFTKISFWINYISGEPLIFIEVALLKDVACAIKVFFCPSSRKPIAPFFSCTLLFYPSLTLHSFPCTWQEVLWNNPPFPESEASCALFYSISSTQVIF